MIIIRVITITNAINIIVIIIIIIIIIVINNNTIINLEFNTNWSITLLKLSGSTWFCPVQSHQLF